MYIIKCTIDICQKQNLTAQEIYIIYVWKDENLGKNGIESKMYKNENMHLWK